MSNHFCTTSLSHSIFSPGVHWLQDPRSGIYNFDPLLQDIPDVNNFAFERLPEFVKSSRDKVAQTVSSAIYGSLMHGLQELRELAKREGKIFSGSTSSLTGMLSQVYFLISGLRKPDTSLLSLPFNYMVRVLCDFPVWSAHLTVYEGRGLHTWSADANFGPFKLQGRGLRD